MPGCNCTIVGAAPADVILTYSQPNEELTADVEIAGKVRTGQSDNGTVSITVEMRISAYRFVAGDWERIERGRLHNHTRQFRCNNDVNPFSVRETLKVGLDPVYLAGHNLVLLLKCYFKVTGDCGTAGDYNVFKRVGGRLTTPAGPQPPQFENEVGGGNWGVDGHTDAAWGTTSPAPTDP